MALLQEVVPHSLKETVIVTFTRLKIEVPKVSDIARPNGA